MIHPVGAQTPVRTVAQTSARALAVFVASALWLSCSNHPYPPCSSTSVVCGRDDTYRSFYSLIFIPSCSRASLICTARTGLWPGLVGTVFQDIPKNFLSTD